MIGEMRELIEKREGKAFQSELSFLYIAVDKILHGDYDELVNQQKEEYVKNYMIDKKIYTRLLEKLKAANSKYSGKDILREVIKIEYDNMIENGEVPFEEYLKPSYFRGIHKIQKIPTN
ncbi:hypothetical protein ACWOE8_07275 [Enterococcus avium]